jgi:transposase-like protein
VADINRAGKNQLTQRERNELSDLYAEFDGNISEIARFLGIPRSTIRGRALRMGLTSPTSAAPEEPFDIAQEMPEPVGPVNELLERRESEFDRKKAYRLSRRLVDIKVKIDGPFGIAHMGDPHIDDPGTDIYAIQNDVKSIQETDGLFGANVGDQQNLWVGRLAHLWSQQSTSAAEAWALTEWLVSSVNWLYILGGNHDQWAGEGDPLQWILRSQQGVYENNGARLNLMCPGRKKGIRINARHNFAGHSMWNPAHALGRAVQTGWRDHILVCGHTHVSGYMVLKDPASGLISHAMRVAGYKKFDRYAEEKGLADQTVSPAFTTIVRPEFADDDPRLIHTMFNVQEAAEYVSFLRRKHNE